ncbi:gliding motility lipoprotein GldH [Sphingobacterium corticis]|uniref:Gliding motility lipoprotein GldH n=1 Tax=Sphingobacterium corticis TaxID=1812823 RepID=A0ABW5NGP0_9SPHI
MLKRAQAIWPSIVFLVSALLCSCDKNVVFDQHSPVKDNYWERDSLAQFDVHIQDAKQKYHLLVDVRHNNFYPYTSLVFDLREQHESGLDTTYNAALQLTKPDGRWTGKSAGNLYHNVHSIQKNYSFPDTGTYHFSIRHLMEDQRLKGVTDIGLKIVTSP